MNFYTNEGGYGDLLGNQSCLSKNRQKYCKVQRCTPEPVTRIKARGLFQVTPEENYRETEQKLNTRCVINEL